jgi:hypothetical protein
MYSSPGLAQVRLRLSESGPGTQSVHFQQDPGDPILDSHADSTELQDPLWGTQCSAYARGCSEKVTWPDLQLTLLALGTGHHHSFMSS